MSILLCTNNLPTYLTPPPPLGTSLLRTPLTRVFLQTVRTKVGINGYILYYYESLRLTLFLTFYDLLVYLLIRWKNLCRLYENRYVTLLQKPEDLSRTAALIKIPSYRMFHILFYSVKISVFEIIYS